MIYNKPHDISWKLFSSFKSSNEDKKRSKKTDNLIIKNANQGGSAPQTDIDTQIIFNIDAMPVIEGVPILQFPAFPETEAPKIDIAKDVAPPPYIGTVKKPVKEKPIKEKKVKENPVKNKANKGSVISYSAKAQILKIASFFVLLYVGTVFAFIIPMRPAYSESEKRDLAKFPEFTIEGLASGDFFSDINTWFSDTFPFRDFFTGLDGKFKNFYGITNIKIHGEVSDGDEIPEVPLTEPKTTEPEKAPPVTEVPTTEPPKRPDIALQDLGTIIVAGDSAYEYYGFSNSLGTRYVAGVNKIKEKSNPANNVYSLIVPTSIDVTLNDILRKEVNSSDQRKALKFFNSSITNAVAVDTILDTQRSHRDEYIYFRTDHHWTALGAYYAYVDFCAVRGIEPIPLSQYQSVTYNNFTGTFYTNAAHSTTLKENADSVTAYLPFNNNTCTITKADGTTHNMDIVRDVDDFGSTLKYLTFIGGDNPLTTIKNLDNPDGQTCVVIKDSYANAFVPFLVAHYSTIYVIDPRYYTGTLEDFSKDKEVDDVIFISNISTTRNAVFIESLENLVR